MAEVFALPLLFDAVVAQLTADALPGPLTTSIKWGWKEVYKQINEGTGGANRIVFAPGDEAFKFADDLPARNPGRMPRPLATEDEFFTCFVWAYDVSGPDNERKQYTAARRLYDAWRRAIYLATHTDGDVGIGPVRIISQRWNREKLERGFGAEIVIVGAVSAMVPDVGADDETIVDPPLHSNTTVTELGQSQVVHT